MEREGGGGRIHFGARSCRQSAVDGEAALRQLTWALHLILTGENAAVNRRRDQVISFCEDERIASSWFPSKRGLPFAQAERENERGASFTTQQKMHTERVKRGRDRQAGNQSLRALGRGDICLTCRVVVVVSVLRVSCQLGASLHL